MGTDLYEATAILLLSVCLKGNTLNRLTRSDYDLILESLRYTKERFQAYDRYPSEEFRQSRIADVGSVIEKIREMMQSGDSNH